MIKELHIKNFESHLDTKIEFSPGVNVIIGTTEKGKSSIIRSLRWALENKPSGESFRSHSTPKEETTVTVKTNGVELRRGRGKEINYYWCDGIDYVAFGQDVPTTIKDKLKLSSINTQFQFDPTFLLSESPGSVAKFINSIINLDVIDDSLKNINSKVKETDNAIGQTKKTIESLNKEISTYPDFKKIDLQLNELNNNNKTIQENQYTIALLNETIKKIEETTIEIDTITIPTIDIYDLIKLHEEIVVFDNKINNLELLINKIEKIENDYKSIHLPDYNINGLDKLLNQYKKLNKKIFELNKMIKQKVSIDNELNELSKEITEWETIFKQKFPSTCPLCLQPSPK